MPHYFFDTLNLTIDIGNSYTKTAVFDGTELLTTATFERLSEPDIDALFAAYRIDAVCICSVAQSESEVLTLLGARCERVIVLDHTTPMPLTLAYDTPQTLGHDRIAAAIGAVTLYEGRDLLVVDSGTCITSDVITANRRFLGGNISPGLKMRLNAMHRFTARLPEVAVDTPETLIGTNTSAAMLNGAYWGIIHEIEGLFIRLQKQYKLLSIVLAGGSAAYFAKHLSINANVESNLVLIGLNSVLIYNKKIEE